MNNTNILQQLTRRPLKKQQEIEFCTLEGDQAAVLVCDLEKNLQLTQPGAANSRRLLVIAANRRDIGARKVLHNLISAIFQKNTKLMRLDPFTLRQHFQNFLAFERQLLKPAKDGIKLTAQGFALINHKLYNLNPDPEPLVYIYRRGSLLEYRLAAQHFVPVESQDVVLFSDKTVMDYLLEEGLLKSLTPQTALAQWIKKVEQPLRENPFQAEGASLSAIRVKNFLIDPPKASTSQEADAKPGWGRYILITFALTVLLVAGIFWAWNTLL